jgi:glycosyltransferase involved in cell wall biosynthesis
MEGFPNALAEAMLCGCIPIGSNVSGIPYMISDSGYILHHRNVDELESLCCTAAFSLNKVELSKKARKRISSEFTYDYRRKAISKIIEQYTS